MFLHQFYFQRMYITCNLHWFYMHYMSITCLTCLTSTFAMDLDTVFFVLFLSTANLINVHENIRSRPSTWMVAGFLPVSGPDSKCDERGGNNPGNSMAVRNTEIMMECNDCLSEGWNEQTAKTHIEMWPDKSEGETHIVRIGHILDRQTNIFIEIQ